MGRGLLSLLGAESGFKFPLEDRFRRLRVQAGRILGSHLLERALRQSLKAGHLLWDHLSLKYLQWRTAIL